MAGKTLAITYTADAAKALAAQRAIDAGHTKMTGGVTKTSSAFSKAFGSVIPLGYAAAGAAAIGAAKFIVDAATTEGEAQNQVNTIFGKSVGVINKFAEQSAASAGISKGAALEAAGGFGAMLKSAGLATGAAANMSVSVVQLAGDLASFKNVAPEEALEKLRSGLAGEAEPLRQFGIFLSEAAVQEEAVKLGIAKTGEELTEAQKVQARYSIIQKQSNDASGDFARTLGTSLPNQIRKFKAEMTDLAADVGSLVIPALLFLATHVELVVAAFAGFAAVKFVPGLLYEIAVAAEAVGAQGLSQRVLAFAFSISSLGLAASAALAADLAGLAYLIVKISTGADPTFTNELGHALAGLATKVPPVNAALESLRREQEKTDSAFIATGKKVHQLSEEARQAMGEFKQSVVESTQVTIGAFENQADAFSITPKEMKHQLNLAIEIAKQFGKDLKAILTDPSLNAEQKRALAEMPPEYRRAYAEAGKGAKEQLAQDAVELSRLNTRNWGDFADKAKGPAHSGGQTLGKQMMAGAVSGIVAGSPLVAAEARKAVRDALNAAKDEAGVKSPSTVMHHLGLDMMAGLSNGLTAGMGDVVAAVMDASDKLGKAWTRTAKTLEARSSDIKDDLAKLADNIRSFRDEIKSGFDIDLIGGLLGLEEGTDPSAFLSEQVANAEAFGQALKDLQKAGLAKGLVGQIASQGVSALPLAQQLLADPELLQQFEDANKAILSIATSTADKLVESAFGPAADKLAQRMEKFAKRVGDFTDALHADAVDREVTDVIVALRRLRQELDQQAQGGTQATADLTQTIRTELIRFGRRNGGTGI